MAQINVQVDDKVKEQAERLFDTVGLTMSSAIILFLRQSILHREIPFKITAKTEEFDETSEEKLFYSPKNVAWVKESIEQGKQGHWITKTMEELKAIADA
ncbi:hypothetical protein AGMMS49938_17920 [Fibrobacterales bacterium]|nr:hypothetical protein AGMMS49938_17920 [Fibrobacterales bacterium]